MFGLDNKSGINVMPTIAPADSQTPLWFTEGGAGLSATYPGQDWFNQIQAELLNVLKAADISPQKGNLSQLSSAISKLASAYAISVVQTTGPSLTSVMSQKIVTDLLSNKVSFDDVVRELSDDWYKVPSVSLLDQELGKKVSSTTFNQEINKKADKSSLGTVAAKNTGNGTGQIPDMSYFPFSGKGTDSIVVTLPNGLIIQAFKREVVSSVNVGEGNTTPINFPAAFPNKVVAVVCAKSSYVQIAISCENKTLSGFSAVAMKVVPVDVTYSMADFIVLGY